MTAGQCPVLPAPPEPLAAPVIDTHAHLDMVAGSGGPELDRSLELAARVGVEGIVQVGCDLAGSRWALERASRHSQLWAAVALHPNEVPRIHEAAGLSGVEAAWAEIARMAAEPAVRAVGETGMDFHRTPAPGRAIQEESFRRHIQIARDAGKTLIVHDRDAHADVFRILADEPEPPAIVLHCFSGGAELARQAGERGWYCSFAGVVTFKNASESREAVRATPPGRLLVETDAPFLTPVPFRGRTNGSYLMPFTVRALADVLGLGELEVCERLAENSRRAFGIA